MGKIRFGIGLPIWGAAAVSSYSLDWSGWQSIKSMIVESERLGYDSLWVGDHLTMGREGNNLECWTVLSAASQLCKSLRLGPLVLCPTHRSPAMLAKMAATLDVLSNGRLELGLGAGWRQSEQVSYGLPWDSSFKARVDRLVETIKIVKGMWTEEIFSFSGRYYNVKEAVCNPKPEQKPNPRIWLAGKGEKTILKVIAQYADAWNADEVSPQDYAAKLRVLRAHCGSVGTDYERIEKSLENFVLISDKQEDMKRVVDWSNWSAQVQAEYGENKPVVGGLEDMKPKYILGSVAEVTERVRDYISAGVQHFVLYFIDYPSMRSLRSFAEEVVPSL